MAIDEISVTGADRGLSAFRPIRLRKASDEVLLALIDAIRGGLYSPGDLLPRERDLAEQLEVSRTVVRTAIETLRQAGVLSVRRGRSGGAQVLSTTGLVEVLARLGGKTISDLRSILEARRMLEISAALLAARRMTADDFAELGAMADELPRLVDEPEAFYEADVKFHLAVATRSGSEVIADYLRDVFKRLAQIRAQYPVAHVTFGDAIANQRTLLEALNPATSRASSASPTTTWPRSSASCSAAGSSSSRSARPEPAARPDRPQPPGRTAGILGWMPLAGSAPLSVLDLAPVSTGATVGDALRNSLDLAQHVERLGYLRHWVAEHHNMPGIASSAPAVLIAHLAGGTTTIRVGSGGVMLPNHQPLVSPSSSGCSRRSIPAGSTSASAGPGNRPAHGARAAPGRRSVRGRPPDAARGAARVLPRDLPAGHGGAGRRKHAGDLAARLERLQRQAGGGARAAVLVRAPLHAAEHGGGARDLPAQLQALAVARASRTRRSASRSSARRPTSGRSGSHGPAKLSFLRLRSGRPSTLPSPEEAAAHDYSPDQAEFVESWTASHVVGSPETVRAGLLELRERTKADELMLTTNVYEHADRLRSYELVAEALAAGA